MLQTEDSTFFGRKLKKKLKSSELPRDPPNEKTRLVS